MPIRVLDAATIGRIAAGEVVERPASIAKELIENSLDAGATSITVEIRDGGINYLRVTDNGCGIAPNEVRMAFENHATSKISSGDGLDDIRTLGFRGEALPSIAAVSRVTVTTRVKGAPSGVRMIIEGGKVTEFSDYGCPEGTSIVVRDLFFNTPVRREFLKKPTTEGGVVADVVAKLILGNPNAAIRFISAERTVYHSYGDGNVRHAALTVYGRQTAQDMVEVNEQEGAFALKGLIGVGDQGRSNRAHQSFFINGRVVRCPLLTQSLEEATRGLVMIGMYPMCALSLSLPANSVDINVHPNKLEVRFKDEELVRTRAVSLLQRALDHGKMLTAEAIAEEKPSFDTQNTVTISNPPPVSPAGKPASGSDTHFSPKPASVEATQQDLFQPPQAAVANSSAGLQGLEPMDVSIRPMRLNDGPIIAPSSPALQHGSAPIVTTQNTMPQGISDQNPQLVRPAAAQKPAVAQAQLPPRIIGVFARTYVLVEWNDTLLMIDQHAAHERLLYTQYERALHQGTAMQQLLVPITLNLSQSEYDLLIQNQQTLYEAGYELEPFGERDIRVTAVPHVLGQSDLRLLFMELIDQLSLVKSATIERRRAEVIQASCKHAVKGGDALTEAELNALLEDMMNTDAPSTCPHGRPVYKAFKRTELERMFKRIV